MDVGDSSTQTARGSGMTGLLKPTSESWMNRWSDWPGALSLLRNSDYSRLVWEDGKDGGKLRFAASRLPLGTTQPAWYYYVSDLPDSVGDRYSYGGLSALYDANYSRDYMDDGR